MYFIDLNEKQKQFIYSKCTVKHFKDSGPRVLLYKRLIERSSFTNTFVTNFTEKLRYEPYREKIDNFYDWEYDTIYVPIKYANLINKFLSIHNDDILRRR